jgi:phosphatidylserine decarboxylase
MAWLVGLGGFAALFALWRFYWFFRDPARSPPPGDGVLAPADGTVVYVHRVAAGEVPVAVKQGRNLRLSELFGLEELAGEGLLIGIFMSAFDVHVNRAPISGRVKRRTYAAPRRNRTMGRTFANLLAGRRPLADGADYLVENERNTLVIEGERLCCAVTQIADLWARRILCGVREGDLVVRGERYGRICMGSQVDLFVPSVAVVPRCQVGQHVRAGETVIAELAPSRR